MSVPRSSIARTRDKRVPKIPARFDDFSEIPPSTYLRNYLRESQKNIENTSTSPFHPSITFLTSSPTGSDSFKEQQQVGIHSAEDKEPEADGEEQEEDPEEEEEIEAVEEAEPVVAPVISRYGVIAAPKPLSDAEKVLYEEGWRRLKEAEKTKNRSISNDPVIITDTTTNAVPNIADKTNTSNIKTNININNKNNIKPNSPPPPKKQKKEISNSNIITSDINLPQIPPMLLNVPKYTTTNMQYGTRLMLNEPIYLPRSVATIAPITTTYEQIVSRSRKPPFVSKKAEAYLNYQDERKFNYILSLNSSLAKIAEQLDITDLVNLRAVNKTWRTVVDNKALWHRVEIGRGSSVNWKLFYSNIVDRFGTQQLILNDYVFRSQGAYTELAQADKIITNAKILSHMLLPDDGTLKNQPIRHIEITTTGPEQNSFALALCLLLYHQQYDFYTKKARHCIKLCWQVKVFIDSDGLAKFKVPNKFAQRNLIFLPGWLQHLVESNIYMKDARGTKSNEEEGKKHCLIDFYELKEMFECTLYRPNRADTLQAIVKAI